MSKMVRVELSPEGNVIRIFRDHSWLNCSSLGHMTNAEAVGAIRKQVFERARSPLNGQFECRKCGRSVTWESGEMNEIVPKGSARRGEVSLSNCEVLCPECHRTGPDAHHANRRWQTSKLNSTSGTP